MILIDDLRIYVTELRIKRWCHMVSDTSEDELHEFAQKLGLKREWFQCRPAASVAHYDLTALRRAEAIRLGATVVSRKELVKRNYDRRVR